jgi:hypothetical protein
MINLFTLNMISERVYVERGRRKSSERLLMVLESQHDHFSALLGHEQRATQRRGLNCNDTGGLVFYIKVTPRACRDLTQPVQLRYRENSCCFQIF